MIQNVPAETERYDKFNENLSYLCYIYQKERVGKTLIEICTISERGGRVWGLKILIKDIAETSTKLRNYI